MGADAETLYTANHGRLFRYFCRAVGHVETARDLTQDVFVRVSRSVIPDAPEGPLRGWLFQIARNLALDHHRRGQRRPPHEALTDVNARPASQDTSAEVNEALASHRKRIAAFAERGGLRRAAGLVGLFDDLFPMLLPPDREDGLGVLILNSNADTHFSFTNALGLVSVEQMRRLAAALGRFPRAQWIVALHHHLIEYPMPVANFSERIGTALVNGSWFVRKLRPFAKRAVVMHGHRHIDWIGACGALKIISAPSPVMGGPDAKPSHFLIHTLAAGANGQLCLLPPQRVEIAGETGG